MGMPVKKLKNGFAMPVFGIGTWYMGGGLEADTRNDEKDIHALRASMDVGITHIDSAELYGRGHAEELVGQAIQGRNRSTLFLVSKVFKEHLKHEDVLASCRASLGRLGTEYLDLYLVHAPNPDIPIRETMKAFDELKEQGLIKNIGVSNFNVEQLEAARAATKNPIVVDQLHYSLAYRTWQDAVEYCEENDILITAYRPVERGVLTTPGVAILDAMCRKYKKTPAQVAIQWLISQDNVVTIAKMSSADHLNENLGALGWNMDIRDVEKLKKEFPEVELPRTVVKFEK
ncbi:MAG: aldo/keto reductase [Minisyncoccia bacterium]|jgi:diketogulonate reductase-like aldo/keto reductase